MNETKCDGCRFARWDRTKNGRLHPSGFGKCDYIIKLPYAVVHESRHKGAIIRGAPHRTPCECREEHQ